MSETTTFIEYANFVRENLVAFITGALGILTYAVQNRKLDQLEEENVRLKREIHKISGKVDPESDRQLLMKAQSSVQIMGINSLGPLHHCREEIIDFLSNRNGTLQVLLLDPRSEQFRMREEREGDRVCRIRAEWHASVNILLDIEQHVKRGCLDIRIRQDVPTRALFIVDALNGLQETSKMLINYYPDEAETRGYSGAQFLAEFIMERDRDSMVKNLAHFSSCWAKASPLTARLAHSMA